MAIYSDAMDLGLGIPTPEHVFNAPPVDTMQRLGHERRLERKISSLVTDHGNPHVEPYDGPVPAAAKRVATAARAAGFKVIEHETAIGCIVEGLHEKRRVGFRAYWIRGKTAGGTWHSGGFDKWKLVDISARPIGVDAKTKLTKAGCRHDANDRTRLVLVESPRGVRANITEIERRIKA